MVKQMSDRNQQINEIRNRKQKKEKCVFTNGCFDILHKGHIELLRQAREMGDFLVVGLNSDDSVYRLKGFGRPVNDQDSRVAILKAIRYVDYVVIFEEDTPYELIKAIQPDILVKGGDYSPDEVVGCDLVRMSGGRVEIVKLVEGYSTSRTIRKVGEGLESL